MTTPASNEVAARFDRAAADWDTNPIRVALAKAVADAIRRAVPLRTDMKAMDFGAGTGLLTLAILPYVATVTAVDASSEMLRVLARKLAEQGIHNVGTMHADITAASLPEAAFDAVVSAMALHHIQDVPSALGRLRACLRPGGWMALADLDAEDGTFHPDPTGVYHSGFDRAGLCAWLAQAGFANVSVGDAYRVDRGGRFYGVFLVTGQAA